MSNIILNEAYFGKHPTLLGIEKLFLNLKPLVEEKNFDKIKLLEKDIGKRFETFFNFEKLVYAIDVKLNIDPTNNIFLLTPNSIIMSHSQTIPYYNNFFKKIKNTNIIQEKNRIYFEDKNGKVSFIRTGIGLMDYIFWEELMVASALHEIGHNFFYLF